MVKKMIKAVIFDIDNTLIDFLEMKKKSIGPAIDAMIGEGLELSKEEATDKIYDLYLKFGMEYKLIFQELLKPVPELFQLFFLSHSPYKRGYYHRCPWFP